MSDLDYEYLPSDDATTFPPQDFQNKLESVFPPGTPAGLRGEAVRSALKSGRCLAWKGDSVGLVQVRGKGTLDFLSNKLSQSFQDDVPYSKRACLLNRKGRLVDLMSVAVVSPTRAYMLTLPGQHASGGKALFDRLNPLVFPMDQIELQQINAFIFSVASVSIDHVQYAVRNYVVPRLPLKETWSNFPSQNSIRQYEFTENGATLLVLPDVSLPSCACVGYTFVFLQQDNPNNVACNIYKTLVGDETPQGPVEIGPLEYETLRIEAGQPSYGFEYTAGMNKQENDEKSKTTTPASPMELHLLQPYVDMDKGCYLGQEGIASMLRNKRGPPRTLYSVVFEDQENLYQHQTLSEEKEHNPTTVPLPGQELFVLGSNQEISVGFLTSVAEPGGTGDARIVALALVKRADSIQSKMKEMDIQMPPAVVSSHSQDGMVMPPPMDPLDGLEVIVGGTWTVGTLRSIPKRRMAPGQNMFVENSRVKQSNNDNDMAGSVMGYRFVDQSVVISDDDEPDNGEEDQQQQQLEVLQQAEAEAAKAQAEAEAAAAEAKRKAEKMEMLQQRAQEAMERRRKKKNKKQ